MAALASAPILPEAAPLRALSAQLRPTERAPQCLVYVGTGRFAALRKAMSAAEGWKRGRPGRRPAAISSLDQNLERMCQLM
jgi:hypothetical protein